MVPPGMMVLAPDVVRGFQEGIRTIGAGLVEFASRIEISAAVVKREAQVAKFEAQGVNAEAQLVSANVELVKLETADLSKGLAQVRQRAGDAAGAIGRFAASARSMAGAAAGAVREVIKLAAAHGRAAIQATLAATRTVAMAIAQRVVAVATKAWTIVQAVLNVVMSLNPLGLVVIAIGLLVGALILAYKRSATFRDIVQQVFTVAKNVVVGAINMMRGAVSAAIAFIVNNVAGIQRVVVIVRDAFERARTAVGSAISRAIDIVASLPGRAIAALGSLKNTLFESGRSLIQGLIDGIARMAGNLVSAIKRFVLDAIPGPVKRALGISSPSRLMAEFGRNIGEGLVVGIESTGDRVSRAMARLVPVPRAVTVRPSIASIAAATAAALAAPSMLGAARAVTVNVYPRAGQSEQEIGRVAAREIAWAAKRS